VGRPFAFAPSIWQYDETEGAVRDLRIAVALILAFTLLVPRTWAANLDVVHMRDGTTVVGRVTGRTAHDDVIVRTTDGREVILSAERVVRIEIGVEVPVESSRAKTAAGVGLVAGGAVLTVIGLALFSEPEVRNGSSLFLIPGIIVTVAGILLLAKDGDETGGE
jgi:hypothetical protein